MEKPIKSPNTLNPFYKDIISDFISIENNILELKNCSSEDFDELHEKVTENLSLSEALNKNYSEIFELFGSFGSQKALEDLFDDYKITKSYLGEMEQVIEMSSKSINDLLKNLDMVAVPLNNFNQNLSSLKILLANIKLINTSNNRSLHGFNCDESYIIEKIIDKVKDVCPVIKENVFVLKNHLNSLQKDINDLRNNELRKLINQAGFTHDDVYLLIEQVNEVLKERLSIEKMAEECYDNINCIINELQFKDILRREVGFFQCTFDNIIKKLSDSDGRGQLNGSFYSKLHQMQIPRITDNQLFRLMQINKEYQVFVEKISVGMINNKKEINDILSKSKFVLSKFHVNKDVDNNIREFIAKLSKILIGYRTFSSEINLIYKIVKDLSDKFHDVEMMESAVEQKIIDKIHSGDILNWPDDAIAQQAQKIYKLYADNHFEKSKLNKLFNESFENINSIIKTNAVFSFKNNTLKKLENTLDNSKTQFEKLTDNIEHVQRLKAEIVEIGKKIAANVDKALEQTKYYGFFENSAKQVIANLNQINGKLKSIKPKIENGEFRRHEPRIINFYNVRD